MNGYVKLATKWCLAAAIALSAKMAFSNELADFVAKTGTPYRDAVDAFVKAPDSEKYLRHSLNQRHTEASNARQARILLARIQHPEVFAEFDNEIRKFREDGKASTPHGRSGERLFNCLYQFTIRGPESKVIEVDAGWELLPAQSERQSCVIMRQRCHEKVEKYTDAEVMAGIARNAAARQAVLEHFLKFLPEGDSCEQGVMIWLVDRLWGRSRILRTRDLAAIDHVQDAEVLIEAIFRDASRPAAVRMRAAFCLAAAKPTEVQAFMLNVVTNTSADDMCHQAEDMVNRALAYLEFSAGVDALAVLKRQTNGPAWKLEKVKRTIRAIEGLLPASPQEPN